MLDPAITNNIIALFNKLLPDVTAVYLFGSQSTGEATASSDLDLAFIQFEKPSGELIYGLKTEISYLTKKDVDLVDLFRADLVTAAQVVSTGKVLYCNDTKFLNEYETVTYSRYASFNEERKEILKSIKEKGIIHDR